MALGCNSSEDFSWYTAVFLRMALVGPPDAKGRDRRIRLMATSAGPKARLRRLTKTQLIERVEVLTKRVAELEGRRPEPNSTARPPDERAAWFDAILQHSPAAIYLKDLRGRYVLVNRQFEEWFAPPGRGAVGLTVHDLHEKRYARTYAAQDREVIDSGKVHSYERELPSPDGTNLTHLIIKFPVFDSGGELAGIGGLTYDITDRKRAEEALRQSEELFRTAIDSLQEGFALFDADDRLLVINETYRRLNPVAQEILDRGGCYEDLLRANVKRGALREAIGREEAFIRERLAAHRNPKGPLIRTFHDGRTFLVRERRTPENMTTLSFIDISERVAAEGVLREKHELLESILRNIPLAIFWKDRDLRYVGCNDHFARDRGDGTRESIIGKTIHDIAADRDEADAVTKADGEVLHSGIAKVNVETTQIQAEGRERVILHSKVPLRDAADEVTGILGIYADITDRKRAENALQESEARLRLILESASIGIGVDLLDGRTIQANPALQRLLGYSAEELLERHFTEYTHPDYAGRDAKLFKEMVAGKRSSYQIEKRYIRKDGAVVWGRLTRALFSGEDGDPRYALGMVEDITERKQAEEALRESEERLRAIIDHMPATVVLKDTQGRILLANKDFLHRNGLRRHQTRNKTAFDLQPSELARTITSHEKIVLKSGAPREFELDLVHPDGQKETLLQIRFPIFGADGDVTGIGGIGLDVTEQRQMTENIGKLSRAVEQSPASVIILDTRGDIEYVNPKFVEMTGYAPFEVTGQTLRLLESGNGHADGYDELWDHLVEGRAWQGELHSRRKTGELYWEYASVSPLKTPEGVISHFVAVNEDITLRKQYERRLLHQATHDEVTGLPNRMLAFDRLGQAVARARRYDHKVGVLLIDLDRFKLINDTLGHPVGDRALKMSGERIRQCLREEDTLARVGGDEFTVVLPGLGGAMDVDRVATKILEAFAHPLTINGQELFLTPSMGITIWPDDGNDPETLVRNADAAMYQAKEMGRNNARFFTRELDEQARARTRIETQLRHALDRSELSLHYQPILDLRVGEVVRAEALLRWTNQKLGKVPPAQFVPIAEEIGLIVPIGEWVMARACQEAKAWQVPDRCPLGVSVNVSIRQFRDSSFLDMVMRCLESTGLPPELMEIEITESFLMADMPEVTKLLQALKDLGIRISVDDFGTGYSSLSYLQRFPVDTLKIDQSFVRSLGGNSENVGLIKAIITMAKSLHLEVVAEGVETRQQASFLSALGCHFVQGNYFGPAIPPEEFVRRWRRTPGLQSIDEIDPT